MKILLLTPFLPYPGAGHAGSKYSYYLLHTLAVRNEVHLVTRSFPGEETHLRHLRRIVAGLQVVEGPGAYSTPSPTMLPRVVASYRRLGMLAQMVLERERFDVCQVEFTESGVFWKAPRAIPAVMTLHDVVAKPARRRYLAARGVGRVTAWGKWRVTRALEAFVASKFQQLFALSDEDRRWANDLYPKAKVRVLRYPAGIEFVGLPRREVPGRVLFVGALNRPPNLEAIQWFVDGCWPSIQREIPEAEFHIVGHGLPELCRTRWSTDPTIKIVGPVESVERHYKEAAVFIAPILIGGGVIVKILDGLAAGVPVVTTTRGNEGINAEDGKSALVADSPELFAMSVVRLLRNRELREAIGESGRRYVGQVFSPISFASTLNETYTELTQGRRLAN
jgi:glycosyltransferase involved in cell wall biosynthesis